MTREEMREAVARALCQEKCAFYGDPPCWGLDPAEYVIEPWNPDKCDEPGCGALADAAIAIIRGETLEAGARAAMDDAGWHWDTADEARRDIWRRTTRAAFVAMVEAWPMHHIHEWQRPWLGGMSGTDLILPLTENPDDKA